MIHEKEVGAFEAKNKLSALLDEAARGHRIWITRHGRRVALLSSGASPSDNRSSLSADFRRIRRLSKPGAEPLKHLVDEGRQ